MSRKINIYKIEGTTCVDETINGVTQYFSTNNSRDLIVIRGGVVLVADEDENTLNNFKILISELDDDFGAKTPLELRNILLNKEFFTASKEEVESLNVLELLKNKLDKNEPAFTKVITINNAIGEQIIDYDAAIKYIINWVGNGSIKFMNFEKYEEQKVQCIQMYATAKHMIGYPSGVNTEELSDIKLETPETIHTIWINTIRLRNRLGLLDPIFYCTTKVITPIIPLQ